MLLVEKLYVSCIHVWWNVIIRSIQSLWVFEISETLLSGLNELMFFNGSLKCYLCCDFLQYCYKYIITNLKAINLWQQEHFVVNLT